MGKPGARYALSALREKRSALAGEIEALRLRIGRCEAEIAHLDASLSVLDPATDPASLATTRFYRRVKIFRQGELGRIITGVLRRAERPLGTHQIVTAMLEAGGYPDAARTTLTPRIRTNLAYQEKRGTVLKIGKASSVAWVLMPSSPISVRMSG